MSDKKYWQSFAELNDTERMQKLSQNEFGEELPFEDLDGKGLLDAKTPRRDFLKYLGFSTVAATVAASCENPVRKAMPYVNRPENVTPGVAKYYASTYVQDGDVVPVEPAQFRIAREVRHAGQVGGERATREEPADVAAPEPVHAGRMEVFRRIGIGVVMAMVRRPQQRASLHARGADQREGELHRTRGAERAMREIAMVERGDREHPHRVQHRRNRDRRGGHADPEHAEARQVHRDEGRHAHEVEPVALIDRVGRVGGARVEPSADRGERVDARILGSGSGHWVATKDPGRFMACGVRRPHP